MTSSDSDSSPEYVKPSKFRVTAVDTEGPSTSIGGNSTMMMGDVQGNEFREVTKRKLSTNGKCHERVKRLRSTEAEPPQVGRNSDVIMDTDSTESCLGEDRPPEQDTEILSDDKRTYETNATVRDTLHGNVYQWKHMLLLLLRARKKGCKFSFATEMKPAGKFDDAVLEYEVPGGGKVHRFLQFKHVQGDRMITVTDLLTTVKNAPFRMGKYFDSFREIRSNTIFKTSESKDLILCTNCGLDVERLEAEDIKVTKIKIDDFLKVTEKEQDDLLEVAEKPKQTPCFYKFVDERSSLGDKLKSEAGASDEEILNFFKEFILAVNQPNEKKLGEMIKHELSANDQFNLLDVDLIMDFFLNIMVNLLKQPEKNRKFLTEQKFDDIFKKLHGKLSCLITIGLKSPYLEELKRYDIKFEVENSDLRKFLDSTDSSRNSPLILTSPNPTLLTALRVYDTVKQLPRYKKMDSSIFIRLEELLSSNITDVVSGAFGSSICNVLLVIDCRSISNNGDTQTLWSRLRDILGKNRSKKLILIIRENDSSAVREIRREGVDDIVIDDSIVDLAKDSQQKLLNKNIIKFQGHEERTLGEIFGIHDFDNIESNKLSALKKVIKKETLIQLIHGEEIVIGNEIQGLGDVEKYYIPRTIVEPVVSIAVILKDSNMSDLFAIGDIDQKALEKMVATENRNQSLDESSLKKLDPNKFYILQSGREADHFRNICKQNPEHNIHWLRGERGALVWQQSFGSITNLQEFRNTSMDHDNHDRPGANGLTEDILAKHDKKRRIVILSDTAGMGKSTLLTYLAGKIQHDQSSLLVIRVDLTQHTGVLDAEEKKKRTFEKDDMNGAVNFLVDKLSNLRTDFERNIFKEIIKVTGETAVLIDGYDEICPVYGKIVIDLLRSLAELPIKRLLVTTRPHTSDTLERELRTFSHVLQPFDRENQMEFLTQFWDRELNSKDSNPTIEENLKERASKVLAILSKLINSQMQEFTGIPLQLRLVAEAFPFGDEGKLKRLESSEKPIYITILYRCFVKKKFEIFFEQKSSADSTNLGQQKYFRLMYRSFLRKHQRLALEALFAEETVTALMECQRKTDETSSSSQDEEDKDDGEERSGIVTQVINGKPHFIHRTFAEYFAALFLSKKLKGNGCDRQMQKFFVKEFLIEPRYETIRAFLNCLLLCGKNHAPEKDYWAFKSERKLQVRGRTLYHVAAKERNTGIVSFFSIRLGKSLTAESPRRDPNINLEDRHQRTPLMIAVTKHMLALVKCLIEGGAEINRKSEDGSVALQCALRGGAKLDVIQYLVENAVKIEHRPKYGSRWLQYAFQIGAQSDVVEYLVTIGAKIDHKSKVGSMLLHSALQNKAELKLVKYLVEDGADINRESKDGLTPLCSALKNKSGSDVVEYLVENGAKINPESQDVLTPLCLALENKAGLDVVKYLVKKGAEINRKSQDGLTPLGSALKNRAELNLVEYLVESGAEINLESQDVLTPLCLALENKAGLDVVEYLVENGAEINRKSQGSLTPLGSALKNRAELNLVEYLVENGAEINPESQDVLTPLCLALENKAGLDVVEYLVKKGAEINRKSQDGLTPLCSALKNKAGLNVVKYLVKNGAEINRESEDGSTALHFAFQGGDTSKNDFIDSIRKRAGLTPLHSALPNRRAKLNIVKYLVANGAKINHKSKDGSTALHCALRAAAKLDVIAYLVENGAKINHESEDGSTTLHCALHGRAESDVIKYLVENGTEIDRAWKDGFTPLLYALRYGAELDIVKSLVKNRVEDIYTLKDGTTALHYALQNGVELDVLKFLIDNGAEINPQSNDGSTALHWAFLGHRSSKNRYYEEDDSLDVRCAELNVVNYLVENGAEINRKSKDGSTALRCAFQGDAEFEIIKYLVENGAKIDLESEDGSPALRCAFQWKADVDIIKYLVENGAEIDLESEDGSPAPECALQGGVIMYLVEVGAKINPDFLKRLRMGGFSSSTPEVAQYLYEHGRLNYPEWDDDFDSY